MSLTPELASVFTTADLFLADAGRLFLRLAAMFFMAYLLMLAGSLCLAALRLRAARQAEATTAARPPVLVLETERAGLR